MKFKDIENMILASDHLPEEELDRQIKIRVADYAWWLRTKKWNTHFAIYKHGSLPEISGMAQLAEIMKDIVAVKHPKLQDARSILRLYLSREIPSKTNMNKMKALQMDFQDPGRDEIELSSPLLCADYRLK